ncbi:putative DEAD-box ATP-dependent RNA helicase 48 [Silene latifolia]|uniref:putative DEAD-box ATP-dependent RNA helicase 48 n=1 Tax=Silene latifolia TaxID=37657 RepID=UPI003D778EC8
MSTLFLRRPCKTLGNKVEWSLIWARPMGGGPRTFPGGFNKWKWRRLHEKKAMDKEKRLLDQEKQLYQARLRSQIRVSTVSVSPDSNSHSHSPLSPRDHVKALADRFVKPGAEDLWTAADGPLHDPAPNFQQKRGYCSLNFNFNLQHRRGFSSCTQPRKPKKRRYGGSSSEEDDDDEDYPVLPLLPENARWPKFSVEKPKQKEERGRKGARGFIGSAVLGKYDAKITKTRMKDKPEPLTIHEIKQQVMLRKLAAENPLHENVVHAQPDDDEVVDDFVSTGKRFDQCGISPLTVKALSNAGYITMSKVQEDTLSLCLNGNDVLVKAKAGTGKTAAFLLPAIETVLKAISSDKVQRVAPIYVLVLCPTRELACQIAAETRALLKYHDGLGVQVISGGTRFKDDLRRLESDPCQILVATPGRLLDHVESRSGLSVRLMGLKMLVLDEADHLLDLGFRKDMERIVDCLPRERQSLLFSATVPKEVRRISQLVLKREHVCINTEDENCPETNSKVKQSYVIVPHDMHFQVVYQLLKKHISGMPDYKVIVFCTTGMVTSLMYLLFREMRLNVREIHSRKPQFYRSRIADEFKESKRLILISSDVSSRGMDYPDVSLVIQVGIPSDRLQYIHRIGRTGRAGKYGEGILVLAPWEEHFLEEIRDLHVEKSSAPHISPEVKLKMEDSMSKVDTSVKEAAYHAWLGYYNSIKETGRDKTSLVKWANQFCVSIGLEKPPALFRKTAVKMGLKDIPGIRLRK